jgi:hypothetical protein
MPTCMVSRGARYHAREALWPYATGEAPQAFTDVGLGHRRCWRRCSRSSCGCIRPDRRLCQPRPPAPSRKSRLTLPSALIY